VADRAGPGGIEQARTWYIVESQSGITASLTHGNAHFCRDLSPVHATGAHLEHDRPAVDGGPVPIPITFAAPSALVMLSN